ncbi:MAG: hypothetical protein M3069_25090 [Chloroflexota bacterium]|nr:hypothetical protein [Chloroflexota bacterium]
MIAQPIEERIEIVDIWQLRNGLRWPIMRVLARRFVEEVELGRYMRALLATRRWSVVRVVPRADERGLPSTHVFDVYGIPSSNGVYACAP